MFGYSRLPLPLIVPHTIKGKCSLFSLGVPYKMQNYALWWPVVGGLAFLTVLILVIVLTGDHSPHPKTKQKQKKSKKRSRSRSPQDTTGHGLKKRTNVFKQCGRCRHKITVTDTHNLCLACLGREHRMLNCNQCMAFTWKTFRSRFLR